MKVLAYRVSRKFEGCGLTTLHIDALDCQLQKKQMRIVNVEPFKIIYDDNGIVRNYTDRVNVSVHNLATKTISFDTMSVLSIAHYTEHRLDVPDPEEHLAAIDADLDKVDKLNQYVSSYLNQLESDMLFEDIEAMHKQQAIDSALANRDASLFISWCAGRYDMSSAVPTASTTRFKNLETLYEKYATAHEVIVFEGSTYLLKGRKLNGELSKHYYRCEEELHNLVIHRICGKVYLVDGIYSIKPLKI